MQEVVVGIGAVKQTGRHRLARPPTLGLQTVSGKVPMREISCAVLQYCTALLDLDLGELLLLLLLLLL